MRQGQELDCWHSVYNTRTITKGCFIVSRNGPLYLRNFDLTPLNKSPLLCFSLRELSRDFAKISPITACSFHSGSQGGKRRHYALSLSVQ